MNKILFLIFKCVIILFAVTSCNKSDDYPPIKIKRLDKSLYNYTDLDSTAKLKADSIMSDGINAITFMLNFGHPDDSAFIKYVRSDAVKMFSPDVFEKYPDLNELENTIGGIKINLKKVLPNIKFCDIYSVVLPYKQSIYIADSIMLIALNHYLGHEHKAYDGFDEYLKLTKEPKYTPYDIVESLISSQLYFQSNGENTILSKMLYNGAIIYAKMQIVPNAILQDALAYSEAQLDWLDKNEKQAWETLVTKELLYSTSYFDSERLFSLSPASSIIHPEAPGRIGRYFGYRIIEKYLKTNPSTTLEQLFNPEFYNSQQPLILSEYNGN